jgi:DNA-binding NarL/FixJ family response regulator
MISTKSWWPAQQLQNPLTHYYLDTLDSPILALSYRELHLINLLLVGYNSKHIAGILECSERTIETHRADLANWFGAHNPVQLGWKLCRFFNTENISVKFVTIKNCHHRPASGWQS